MRRTTLLITLLLLGATAASASGFPRHVDPEQLSMRNPEPFPLFELYSSVYAQIVSGDYSAAEETLSLFREIASPAATDKALEAYNELLYSFIGDLNETERYLRLASQHLKWLDDPMAELALRLAEPHLEKASGTTVSLDDASKGIASILRASPARLQEGVENVSRVVERLRLVLTEGLEDVERIKLLREAGLNETLITLEADSLRPYLGDSVTLKGTLSLEDGSGLPGKTVEIIVDGSPATVETGPDGGFSYRLDIPYRYVDSLRAYAQYFPGPEDSHLPSVSEPITIHPIFYTPSILVTGPPRVYPGKSFTVTGKVTSIQEPLQGIEVTARYLGSTHVTTSDENGDYRFTLQTRGDAAEGQARVTVSSAPRALYGPASATLSLSVTRDPVELRVDGPTLLLSGMTGAISGRVTVGGAPLTGCRVQITLGEELVAAVTGPSGTFNASMAYPFTRLSSRLTYLVVASPAEPWYSSGSYRESFYLLNPLPALGLLLALAALAANRRRLPPPTGALDAAPPLTPQPTLIEGLTGPPGLYVKAVHIVAGLTGAVLPPSFTIREYLAGVKPRLRRTAYGVFQRISRLYEAWAYGREKSSATDRRMESLLGDLEGEDG